MIPEELREQMKTSVDWIGLAIDVSIDYDGYKTSEGLKSLIDEMREYCIEALKELNKE